MTSTASEFGSQFLSSQKAYTEFEGNFKLITRGIVSLAVGLSHNKEVKDFFVHLVEKVRLLILRGTNINKTETGLGRLIPVA